MKGNKAFLESHQHTEPQRRAAHVDLRSEEVVRVEVALGADVTAFEGDRPHVAADRRAKARQDHRRDLVAVSRVARAIDVVPVVEVDEVTNFAVAQLITPTPPPM